MTQNRRILELSEQKRQDRLKSLGERYGLEPTFLENLIRSPLYTELTKTAGMGKHARRKLARRLQGGRDTLERVAEIVETHQQIVEDSGDEYYQFIMKTLGVEGYQNYLSGNWTPEIMNNVSLAQRKYLQTRPPSRTETKGPRVRFAPVGEYRTNWNR